MNQDDLSDIQSVILYAYKNLPHASYLILSIEHPDLFKQWLSEHLPEVTPSTQKDTSSALNIAFTSSGLENLGLPQDTHEQFSREFKEGIYTEKRSQLLGDIGSNASEHWEWGGKARPTVDAILLCFSETESGLSDLVTHLTYELEAYTSIHPLTTEALYERKEHFGFRDGVSQPGIKGIHTQNSDQLPAGEFLLGHTSAYGSCTPAPGSEHDKSHRYANFGYNGSYLVFRQLEQDVQGFWRYLDNQSSEENDKVYLAAKMVGRWPNGAPLELFPDREPEHFNPNSANSFDFSGDTMGHKCPMASHIRRTNPRATDLGLDEDEAVRSVNHHRILRRGRPYGKPLHSKLLPTSMLKAEDNGETRGLQFLCFNADLARQFEFIQQTWVNNEKFNGLYNDLDPILGARPRPSGPSGDDFSIPKKPIRQRLKCVPQFVTTRGASYFFMPSLSALKQLAHTDTGI